MSHFNETLHSKPVLTAGLMAIITVGLIVLEIYVDIHTGIENATTEYQKFVMGWMGAFLGAFSAISVVASGALKQLNKQTAFNALAFLSLLLAVYSLLVWISFFCTMWVDYSTTKIENSIEHRAKVLTVKALEGETSSIDSAQASSAHVTELNQTASAEDLAVKNCSKLKSWRKVRDCKNEHGAKYDAVNRELSEINSARESNRSRIDSLKSMTGNDSDNSLTDFVMMPLAAMITESKESGKNLMLSVAVLITVIVSYITNCGLYFVGSLIGGDYLKRQQVSPALPISSEESRLWTQPKPEAQAVEKTAEPEPEPQSWADRYKAGEVSAWSGLFNNNQPSPAAVTAYSVTAPKMQTANAADALLNSATNADAAPRRGSHEYREFDDVGTNADVVNTLSPTILEGVGFSAREIPNPNYQPPVIHWQPENPAGVEIAGIEEPDAVEISRPAASECVQIDADDRVQTDADAPNADAAKNARSVVSLAKIAKTANPNGRGIDSLMEYSDLENAVIRSNFLLKNDGSLSQNLVEKFMRVGRPKGKRYIALLIENGVINAELKPIIAAKGE